jgi:hypothetical protein
MYGATYQKTVIFERNIVSSSLNCIENEKPVENPLFNFMFPSARYVKGRGMLKTWL